MIVGVVVENFQRCQELQGEEDKTKLILAKWQNYLAEKRKLEYAVDIFLTLDIMDW